MAKSPTIAGDARMKSTQLRCLLPVRRMKVSHGVYPIRVKTGISAHGFWSASNNYPARKESEDYGKGKRKALELARTVFDGGQARKRACQGAIRTL